jgi:light-regulated signal transduction histidine kinase (bacteriophytochrome)
MVGLVLMEDSDTVIGFVLDRTEHRLAEEKLKRYAVALEESNRELESFSYSVSHDLRAPLRHVQGYIELLTRETAASQLSDKAQRHLQTITDASIEMGQLIDDLLAFSRMNQVTLHESHVELDGLVQATVRDLETTTQGRNIDWNIAPLPQVIGDQSALKQVLVNLIGNAVKYSRPRDPAQIEIGCAGEEDGCMILFVRDNGVGFDMQYAHKLFGVFQRLHRADEFEGTGIGLAIVQRVIARHHGRVWAEGTLDRGATFYFTLRPATTF